MQRVSSSRNPALDKFGTGKHGFTAGNPQAGVPATTPGVEWFDAVQEELCSVIESMGIALDGSKRDQLLTAIQAMQRGKATVNVAGGATVTLTAAQYNMPILILTGALTANISLVFPTISGAWIVRNQTTGAFTVTCKTQAGTGLVVSQGYSNALFCDGANLYAEQTDFGGIPVRQAVLSAPVDASGLPAFLPATGASLSLTSQNISVATPLIVAAASGFGANGAVDRIGRAAANLTWGGLAASATNYLYVDVATDGSLTAGSTTLAPVYQFGGTRSTVNGQATFNVQEMSMTVGNGSAAVAANRVYVGEAVTNATTVTSTIAYALQGRYDSGLFAVAPSTDYAKNHCLGVGSYDLVVHFSDDAAGTAERQAMPLTFTTSQIGWYAKTSSRNVLTISTAAYVGHSQSGGAIASGYYRVRANRGW